MPDFDIVVYGASGFTGRLIAEYIHAQYPGRPWAMAGRSLDKLAAVRDEMGLPAETALIAADASDPDSLTAMVKKARVIITTVGPYQLYGEPLVAACAEHGTDYVDLSGEPAFMWEMIEKYDAQAKESGARIVHSCGFDSVPFDMGVYFLQEAATAKFGAPLKDVKCRVRGMSGTASGGTAASGAETMKRAMADAEVRKRLMSPFALTPGFEGAPQPTGHKPYEDTDFGVWVAPFFMATINTKNVHRSNALMGHSYGADFTYEEMMFTGKGDAGAAMADKVAKTDIAAMSAKLKPGDGPSKEERDNGNYDLMFTGVSAEGARMIVGVTGDRDPGYGSTSKMITECAMCLLEEAAGAPGGVLTPAPVFGGAIIDRLRANAGLTFDVEM